jgi:hypothetical protein
MVGALPRACCSKEKKPWSCPSKPIFTYTAHRHCKAWRNKEVRASSRYPILSPPKLIGIPPAATSKHSRAARRATSPGIDTDKSLKNVKPPPADSKKPDVLAAHRSGGIVKKRRKVMLSTKARKRQEKSMDRAEAVMDRTSTKVEKSKGSFRVIQSRKKTWDEINRDALGLVEPPPPAATTKKGKASKNQAEDEYVAEFYAGDDDADMKGAEEGVKSGPVAAAPEAEPVEGEDEVL